MLRSMPSRQFRDWLAYFQLEPFGPSREDLRAGLVAAVVANTSFGRGKGAKTLKPSDFFENLREGQSADMSPQDMADVAKTLTLMMGGKIVKPGEKPPARKPHRPTPPKQGAPRGNRD